jgi:hypothetical protein
MTRFLGSRRSDGRRRTSRTRVLAAALAAALIGCADDEGDVDGDGGAGTGGTAPAGSSGSSGKGATGGASAGTAGTGAGGKASAGAGAAGKGSAGMDAAAGEGTEAGAAGESGAGAPGESGAGAPGSGGSGGSGRMVAPVFDGESGYVEIPDDDVFSEPTSGELTVEAWMRPDSLDMPNRESSGYVHWMGKGVSGEHEWVSRMYQQGNDEDRENRISFYSFNLSGGLGAGSYFQDDVVVGEWIHYTGTFDDERTYIYKNGEERDSDLLSGYDITPENGSAPVRLATRDRNSYFQGAIARVAFYSTRLSESQIAAHYAARGADYDAVILAEPSLVAYYRLDETSGTTAVDAKGDRDGTYHGGVALGEAAWPEP